MVERLLKYVAIFACTHPVRIHRSDEGPHASVPLMGMEYQCHEGAFKPSMCHTLLSNPCHNGRSWCRWTVPGTHPVRFPFSVQALLSQVSLLLNTISSRHGLLYRRIVSPCNVKGPHGPMHPPIALKPFHIGIEREPSLTLLACSTRE